MNKTKIVIGGLVGGCAGTFTYLWMQHMNALVERLLTTTGTFMAVWFLISILATLGIGLHKAFETSVLKRHGFNTEDEEDEEDEDILNASWNTTDRETGEGREVLEIEVPLEVRAWAKAANVMLSDLQTTTGCTSVLIGAVPNKLHQEERHTDDPTFHMTYTMSKDMNPYLFAEMVNSFTCQIGTLFRSQGIDVEIEGGSDGS